MAKRICKALTYRAVATCEVFAIAFITTGHIESAGNIAGLTAITSTLIYVAHEKIWRH